MKKKTELSCPLLCHHHHPFVSSSSLWPESSTAGKTSSSTSAKMNITMLSRPGVAQLSLILNFSVTILLITTHHERAPLARRSRTKVTVSETTPESDATFGLRNLTNVTSSGGANNSHANATVNDVGEFWPNNVTSDCQVVILIPYRNRLSHYHKQMHNLRQIFQSCKPLVIVIHQDDNDFFKRGWLFNVGLHILALRKINSYTCVVTHDVDLLAHSSKNYFSCDKPIQLCSEISCWNNSVPYPQSAGGVVSASLRDWQIVNGYTNALEGWGGEDDHLYWRFKITHMLTDKKVMHRPEQGSGKCECMNDKNHTQRSRAPSYNGIWKTLARLKSGEIWSEDGISDVKYFITKQFIDEYGTQSAQAPQVQF